jgi:hypothetical protein
MTNITRETGILGDIQHVRFDIYSHYGKKVQGSWLYDGQKSAESN